MVVNLHLKSLLGIILALWHCIGFYFSLLPSVLEQGNFISYVYSFYYILLVLITDWFWFLWSNIFFSIFYYIHITNIKFINDVFWRNYSIFRFCTRFKPSSRMYHIPLVREISSEMSLLAQIRGQETYIWLNALLFHFFHLFPILLPLLFLLLLLSSSLCLNFSFSVFLYNNIIIAKLSGM